MADMKEQIKEWLSWYHSWYDNIVIENGLQDKAIDAAKIIESQALHMERLKDALKAIDELWEGDKGFEEEKQCCEKLGWNSPLYEVWLKIRAELKETEGK